MAGTNLSTPSLAPSIKTFNGGLNSNFNALTVRDNEASDLQNIDFDKTGSFVKRNGYTAINTVAVNSGASCTSLHFFTDSTPQDFLIGTFGDKIYKMEDIDGTWDDITGAVVITAGNDNKFVWTTFNNEIYGTNNVDPPIKWTGTGNAAAQTVVTGLTKAKWSENYENYFFHGNVEVSGTRHKTRLYWSAIDDAETWSATDFNEIGLDDQDGEITGLKTLGNRLVIFKEDAIYIAQFTGDADIPFTFARTSSSVGCVSGYSIQSFGNGLIFLARDGFYIFDGNSSLKLSERITQTLTGFNQVKFDQVISMYQRETNRYYSGFASTGNDNNRVITYDNFNNAFSLYTGWAPNAMTIGETSGQRIPIFGDYDGFAYRADNGTDDNPLDVSTPIDSYLWTKWFDFGDLLFKKGVNQLVMFFQFNSGTVDFSYNFDLEDGDFASISIDTTGPGSLWGTGLWGTAIWGGSGGSTQELQLNGRGRLMRFKFANSRAGEEMVINGLAMAVHAETME